MEQEEKVLFMLADCWNEFCKLETQHPDEVNDFKDGIHECKYVLGMRFARKYRPDLFFKKSIKDWTYEEKKEYQNMILNKSYSELQVGTFLGNVNESNIKRR